MTNAHPNSPITGSKNVILVKRLHTSVIVRDYMDKLNIDVSETYSALQGILSVYECRDTGYKFYHPFELAGDGEFYDALSTDEDRYYSSWKKEYEFATDIIKKQNQPRILDVGCGVGNFISRVGDFCEATGLEISETAVEKARANGLDVRREEIGEHSERNEGRYDVVCAFQVLEHVPNPAKFLTACINCLKRGGSLVLAVPNCDPYYSCGQLYAVVNLPPHHMGLWNAKVFAKLASYFPLSLEATEYDIKTSRTRSGVTSSLSMAKQWLPMVSSKVAIRAAACFFGLFEIPRVMLATSIGGRTNAGRVMVHFRTTTAIRR